MYSFAPDRQPARAPAPSPSDAYRRAYRVPPPDAQRAPTDGTSSERAVPQADGEP
jgi:hypothetical protein